MAASQSRIRIPLSQRWNHFRMSWLPILCFLGCVFLTLVLWQRQGLRGTLVGEPDAVSVDVAVGINGIIIDNQLQRFQPVKKGDVLARLDDSLLQAQLLTIEADIQQLLSDLNAVKARVEAQLLGIKYNHIRQRLDLETEREEVILERLDAQLTIAVFESQRRRVETDLQFLQNAKQVFKGAAEQREIDSLQEQIKVIDTQIQQAEKSVAARTVRLNRVEERLAQFKGPARGLPDISPLLQSISVAREQQEVRKREIEVQIERMQVVAPFDGIITVVYKYPGDSVVAGDPIAKLSRPNSEFIVSYWREGRKTRPKKGMEVGIRLTSRGSKEFKTVIDDVGPQVVPVPLHQLTDPNTQEYGTLIKVKIPDGLNVRPGELVHVIYREPVR